MSWAFYGLRLLQRNAVLGKVRALGMGRQEYFRRRVSEGSNWEERASPRTWRQEGTAGEWWPECTRLQIGLPGTGPSCRSWEAMLKDHPHWHWGTTRDCKQEEGWLTHGSLAVGRTAQSTNCVNWALFRNQYSQEGRLQTYFLGKRARKLWEISKEGRRSWRLRASRQTEDVFYPPPHLLPDLQSNLFVCLLVLILRDKPRKKRLFSLYFYPFLAITVVKLLFPCIQILVLTTWLLSETRCSSLLPSWRQTQL